MKTLFMLFLLLSLVACSRHPDAGATGSKMTAKVFQEIISKPGDAVPLRPPLSSVPLWTNGVVSNVMTFATGKVVQETMKGTAWTVAGEYVVCRLESTYYKQAMYSIVTYDVDASAARTYGLYGDGHGGNMVVEGKLIYDLSNRTYTASSTYGNFTETTKGRYTDTEDVSHTIVYQDGALFMTRDITTRPAP